ncbi:MAG: hypothetical protein KDI01_09415 [Halioglobus sp.]|nr:hypothetical protein [Halioglobus sp.]
MPHFPVAAVVLPAVLLAACANYDFRVNDKVVYTPAPLFQAFDIPDTALRTCVEQAIVDGAIRTARQLRTLNCSDAGIARLDGLAVFDALSSLKLSSNNIRNLVEIGAITTLRALDLQNNQIVDPVPLYGLLELRSLDLSGNPALQCPDSGKFALVAQLTLPAHCP